MICLTTNFFDNLLNYKIIYPLGLNKFRYGSGLWTPEYRKRYNLNDGISRHTAQVNEDFVTVYNSGSG